MCQTYTFDGICARRSPAGYVPDRAGDEKPSLKVSSRSRERKRFTPSGFREHCPEILKDISGYVDDCYY